jgi:MSHA biogenesis protein MshJ
MKAGKPLIPARLKAGWERQARRIDALSLRERVILLLSLVAVLAAVFDTLVLTPMTQRATLRAGAQLQQSAEVANLREQFVQASRATAADPAHPLRMRFDAAQLERQQLDAALRQGGTLRSAEDLAPVLQRLLDRQPGLVLERFRLLGEPPAGQSAASAPAGLPTALPGMRWQAMELQVQGRYADLQRYLQALETELPGLRWGEIRITTGAPDEAPRLLAQVFLLKVQP